MFGRWQKPAAPLSSPKGAEELEEAVTDALEGQDRETVLVVVALTGLLGAIAYSDRNYSIDEEEQVKSEILRIQGMTPEGANAVCAALRQHVVQISSVEMPRYCRVLRELGDRELRLEVLELLLGLAARDGMITTAETNTLRQLTTALGLSQSDYNEAQVKHRDHIAALRSS